MVITGCVDFVISYQMITQRIVVGSCAHLREKLLKTVIKKRKICDGREKKMPLLGALNETIYVENLHITVAV